MKTVTVHHTFPAPIDAVFEAVTNSVRVDLTGMTLMNVKDSKW